jgi:hypothetical protein
VFGVGRRALEIKGLRDSLSVRKITTGDCKDHIRGMALLIKISGRRREVLKNYDSSARASTPRYLRPDY